jgi:hypothetical protein
MNDKFDDLAKALAQSVTRRAALKKFGGGCAAFLLAALGLANNTRAGKPIKGGVGDPCSTNNDCMGGLKCMPWYFGARICLNPMSLP